MEARTIDEILPEFMAFCSGSILVAHNAEFDVGFIREDLKRQGMEEDFTVVDTLSLIHI